MFEVCVLSGLCWLKATICQFALVAVAKNVLPFVITCFWHLVFMLLVVNIFYCCFMLQLLPVRKGPDLSAISAKSIFAFLSKDQNVVMKYFYFVIVSNL